MAEGSKFSSDPGGGLTAIWVVFRLVDLMEGGGRILCMEDGWLVLRKLYYLAQGKSCNTLHVTPKQMLNIVLTYDLKTKNQKKKNIH